MRIDEKRNKVYEFPVVYEEPPIETKKNKKKKRSSKARSFIA